jgi:hypothetical protein
MQMILRGKVLQRECLKMLIESKEMHILIIFDTQEQLALFSDYEKVLIVFPEDNLKVVDDGKILHYSDKVQIFKDTYKRISDLTTKKYLDIVAVVTKYKSLVKTKGSDYLFSLVLADDSGFIELKVFLNIEEYYALSEDKVNPFSAGDCVVVKNIKALYNKREAIIFKPCEIRKITNETENIYELNLFKYLNLLNINPKEDLKNQRKILLLKTSRIEYFLIFWAKFYTMMITFIPQYA